MYTKMESIVKNKTHFTMRTSKTYGLTFKGLRRQLFLLRPITACGAQIEIPSLPNKIAFNLLAPELFF